MSFQTRLSGLLFIILLTLAAGSSLVLREELQKSTAAQGVQLKALTERLLEESSQQQALLAVRSLQVAVASELKEVSLRAESCALNPAVVDALQNPSPETVKKANAWLENAVGPLRIHRLLDAQGYVLEASAQNGTEPPAASVNILRYSLLEPPSVRTSVPLQALMKTVLEGTPVASLEALSTDLLKFLTLDASAPPPPNTQDSVLLLLAIHPVRDFNGQVVGAVAAGLDLSTDTALFERWKSYLNINGMSLGLLNGPHRVKADGPALASDSQLTEEQWKSLAEKKETVEPLNDGHVARLALQSQSGQAVGGVEVVMPAPALAGSAQEMAAVDLERHSQFFQHGLGLIGMLGVLTLAIGILFSRTLATNLRRLARKADQASTGRLDTSFQELMGNDEVGELARSFDRMRISLKKLLERNRPPTEEPEARPSPDTSSAPAHVSAPPTGSPAQLSGQS